ncbi:MAG: hypothetical protein ACRDHO_06465 [Actinomycetota bacterium]
MAFRKRSAAMDIDTDRLPDYRLVADVGNPYEPEGLTRTILSGSGKLVVEQQRAEPGPPEQGGEAVGGGADRPEQAKPERPTAARVAGEYDFGVQSAKEMIVRAADFPWSQPFPTRPGIPSEPVLEWTLRDERGPELKVTVWLRDAEKDESMAPVVAALRHAVERATKGELFL